jgi:spoIIIJ-associated protein
MQLTSHKKKDIDVTEQIKIAEEILTEMLELMDFKFALEIKQRDDNTMLCVEGCDDSSRLIGKEGHVLDSLQALLSLIIYRKTGERTNILVDVDGYRENQREKLKCLAEDAAKEAAETGYPVVLEPMNPMERRIVHMTLAERGDVETESIYPEPGSRIKSVQISPVD